MSTDIRDTMLRYAEGINVDSPQYEDIVDTIWADKHSIEEKIALIMELFRNSPQYGILMRFWLYYQSDEARTEALDKSLVNSYIGFFADEDKMIQDAAANSLYFDIFEQPDLAKAMWPLFMAAEKSDEVVEFLLSGSGPVAWEVKFPDLLKLSENKKYQLAVYLCIRHSLFGPNGKIDKEQAGDLLVGLNLEAHMDTVENPEGHPGLSDVELKLLQ